MIFRYTDTSYTILPASFKEASVHDVMLSNAILPDVAHIIHFYEYISSIDTLVCNKFTRQPLLLFTSDPDKIFTHQMATNALLQVDWSFENISKTSIRHIDPN